jgi:RNAse (barnase) inhibitor barstar
MDSLLELLSDNERAGVYQTTIHLDEIVAAGNTVGLDIVRLSLGGVRGKRQMLDRFAKALSFPAHFGHNWDALNDCLCDLDWLAEKGLLLIVTGAKEFVEAHAEDFQTAVEILDGAAAHWRERKKSFWVLIQTQADLPVKLAQIVGA